MASPRVYITQARQRIPRHKALSIGLVILASVFAVHFLLYVLPSAVNRATPALDLAGDWEICTPRDGSAPCDWLPTRVPSDLSPTLKARFNGWLRYRKPFTSPASCTG